jgi:hypothetical protein
VNIPGQEDKFDDFDEDNLSEGTDFAKGNPVNDDMSNMGGM